IVLQTSMLLSERQKIAALAAAMRLPMIYGYREHVVDGGLISYGVDLRDCFRRSAVYVDKNLEGRCTGRSAGRVSNQAGVGHQFQDREAARPRSTACPPCPRGRGDRRRRRATLLSYR